MEPANRSKGGILLTIIMAVLVPALQAQGGERSVRAETRGPTKDVKAVLVNRQAAGRAPRKFAEVEIIPSEQLSEEDILGLPRAPGDDLEVLESPRRLKVQLAVEEVQALVEAGAEVKVVRKFLLFEGSAAEGERQEDDPTIQASCTGLYRQGSNSGDEPIPDNTPGWLWAMSPINISGAPAGTASTCLDVTWQVCHDWPGDVVLALFAEGGDEPYMLWEMEYEWPGCFGETEKGITDFAGEPVNQQWQLWGGDWVEYDLGYIDSWTIKVYYVEPSGYCSADAGCGEYISGVQVGSINNTGTLCSGYGDYTSMSTAMEIGASYPITVTSGNGYSTDECGIWVDWNQDEDFADAGERITPVSGSPGFGPYTATITPPGTAVAGETRMRVRLIDGQYDSMNPCGGSTYGEAEDYAIIVVAGPSYVTISGALTMSGPVGIEGVLISASTGESDTTDAGGFYELEVSEPWTGTVTPSKSYWSFMPGFRSYSGITTDQPGQDYSGAYTAEPTPTISGYVETSEGYGLTDVLVSASTGESTTTVTGGYYELTVSSGGSVPAPWSGTVTPSKDLWSFEPANIVYSDLTADIADQNYAGTYTADPTPTISGYVKTSGGEGIEGVQVYGDNYGGSAITSASGYYELTLFGGLVPAVPRAWSGTVTPGKTDWSFGPVNRVYSDLSSDVGSQNYTGSYVGIGCAAGWLEEWVAWYHGDEVQLYNDLVLDIAVDDSGNICMTGSSVDRTDSGTSYDYATVKYDSSGVELWAARYNGPGGGHDDGKAIAIDDLSNVYVTGASRGVTSTDYATIKYGPDSNVPLWVARYDGPDSSDDDAGAMALDAAGNVYVTGESYASDNSYDYVTIKYGPDSNVPVWVARYDGPGNDSDGASAIAVDDSGSVYVTGGSDGAGTLGDYATIKYDADGNEVWAARYNGPANAWDGAVALAVDVWGNVYVTGISDGNGTGRDIATIKYDNDGDEVWVARYSEPGDVDDQASAIAIDSLGNVYVTGIANWYNRTSGDYVTIKYGPDSNEPVWVARYNGPENLQDIILDMTLDDSDGIYVTGALDYIRGTVQEPASGGKYGTIKYAPESNEPVWVAIYDGPPNSLDIATGVATDNSGNVYVAGYNNAYVTVKYSQCPVLADLELGDSWTYQNLPGQTGSTLTAGVSVTDDPMGNSSYSYAWEILLPGDVSLAPTTVDGGGAGDAYWTFAARGCDEPGGLSDSGQTFTVRVTVTGDNYGNTGQAEAEFGIALLGDVNNDGVVELMDRAIVNGFWRTGSAGPFSLRDCDLNCDGEVELMDRIIANAVWRGGLGQDSVSNPCPLR